jgi:hypothetical protein
MTGCSDDPRSSPAQDGSERFFHAVVKDRGHVRTVEVPARSLLNGPQIALPLGRHHETHNASLISSRDGSIRTARPSGSSAGLFAEIPCLEVGHENANLCFRLARGHLQHRATITFEHVPEQDERGDADATVLQELRGERKARKEPRGLASPEGTPPREAEVAAGELVEARKAHREEELPPSYLGEILEELDWARELPSTKRGEMFRELLG